MPRGVVRAYSDPCLHSVNTLESYCGPKVAWLGAAPSFGLGFCTSLDRRLSMLPTPQPTSRRLAWASALCSDTPTRSPICDSVRKLTPHCEALLSSAQAKKTLEESKVALAAAVSAMPELELASPPAAAYLNPEAAEFAMLPVAMAPLNPLNPEAATFAMPTEPTGGPPGSQAPTAKKPALSAKAPAFRPNTWHPSTEAMQPPPPKVAVSGLVHSAPSNASGVGQNGLPTAGMLRAQMQRMAHELETSTARARAGEAALAAANVQRREERERLERELAQMRIVVAASRATQQREQSVIEDLRIRVAALSDEVCDLHVQKDASSHQLAAQQKAWREQRAECERLEARLLARSANASVATGSTPVASIKAPPAQLPQPRPARDTHLGVNTGEAPNIVAAVAALQQEMVALRSTVHLPAIPAAGETDAVEHDEGDINELEDAPRARTSRSRRGGRGKGGKKAAAANAEALKENAACNIKEQGASKPGSASWHLGAVRRTLQQEAIAA